MSGSRRIFFGLQRMEREAPLGKDGRGEETCNENWARVKNLIADAMVGEVRMNRRAVGDRLVAVSEEEPCRA
jgi:hypothetical protein